MSMMGNGVQDKVHVVCVCVWRPLVVSQETNCDNTVDLINNIISRGGQEECGDPY